MKRIKIMKINNIKLNIKILIGQILKSKKNEIVLNNNLTNEV